MTHGIHQFALGTRRRRFRIGLAPDAWDAVDLQVRVFSNVRDASGNLVPIYIHALSGEEE